MPHDAPAITRILQIAGHQHGAIGRSQLAALGVSAKQRHLLCTSGVLIPAGSATFRVAGHAPGAHQRIMIACLDVAGIASHRTAAALHGIGPWTLDHLDAHRPPDVLIRRASGRYRAVDARVHSTTWLTDDDRTEVGGIPCTSVARTLLLLADPATGVPGDRLRGIVDGAIRDEKATDPWLWWSLERLRRRGRGGIRALEAVLRDRAELGRTESWLEAELLRILEQAGVPLPICQQRIEADGSFVARVDFLYPDQLLVIEVNGHRFHSSREQLQADARRRWQLQQLGYRVLEFTYDDVVSDPMHVVRTVRAALAA